MQNRQVIKAFVLEKLEQLSPYYYYHNIGHTLYVAEQCNIIGQYEQCSKHELHLLEVAALWHDTGFLITYQNHEEASCSLVRKHLPDFNYSTEEIESICTIIMATKIPQTPVNKLGEILADADLEYLGTDAAADRANDLFKERLYMNPNLTEQEWNSIQINFLSTHRYFTSYCQLNREFKKNNLLNQLLAHKPNS